MRDLREDLEQVWRSMARMPTASGGAPVLMFVSARSGEGTTSVAASFACIAARRSEKPAWLVDLDLRENAVYQGFERGFAGDVGRPGRAYDASLKREPIYAVTPRLADSRQEKLLTAHDVEGLPLFVTRFRNERIKPNQKVQVQASPEWWQALRHISGWVIVDAPALDRSAAALTVAEQVDGIVLVVEADTTSAAEIEHARRDLEASFGNILGAVLNRVGSDARLADRFSA